MKNYLIIGGSSGIGRSLSQLLSEADNVYATYYRNKVEDVKINYFYHDALGELDLVGLPDIIDGLAYCPGTIELKPISRFTEENFIEDYRTQVVGAIKVLKAVLPRLKLSDKASVVFFSTVAVKTGFPFHSLVSSSKGAIEGLTKSLAAELCPKIRVNCIAPSITQTPLAQNILSTDEKIQANAQRHPLKKIGQPIDIAELARFLLSNKSSFITGQIIHIDGGISSLKI